jgi:hypothetical protein
MLYLHPIINTHTVNKEIIDKHDSADNAIKCGDIGVDYPSVDSKVRLLFYRWMILCVIVIFCVIIF